VSGVSVYEEDKMCNINVFNLSQFVGIVTTKP